MMIINYSVIISTLNSCNDLKFTIENLKKNNSKSFEVIVIDGNSSDDTISYLKKESFISNWISENDKGIYDAWNKGLNLAKGKWIMFLGAGDTIKQDLFLNYDRLVTTSKKKNDFIFCKIQIGNRVIDSNWNWEKFRKYMNIPHCGGIHNREYFENHGMFNIKFKIAGDYELLLRKKNELIVEKLNLIGVNMKEGGVSQNNLEVFLESRLAKKINNSQNLFWNNIFYIFTLIKHVIKKIIFK